MIRPCSRQRLIRQRARCKALLVTALGLWCSASFGGTVTYVYTDQQGTALMEADDGGNVSATMDYRPYGSIGMGSSPNGPGYTGHVSDPDTALVYMQARYYDPSVGRFLSTDPMPSTPGNGFNFGRYDYANNNPIANIDPDGRCAGSLFDDCPSGRDGLGAGYALWVNPSSSEGGSKATKAASAPKPSAKQKQQQGGSSSLSYDQMADLVKTNNHSGQDDTIIIAMAWKESSFDPDQQSSTSTATGLLQMTKGATKEAGYKFSDMKDPATNIAAGSTYLGMRIRWASGDVAKGLDGYGTGPGYSTDILKAAKELNSHTDNHQSILEEIHD